ncbi:MAG: SDR family NAD(P)-dependent oxidoreductase, partial [Betaproteobacteria bacterium]
MVAAPAAVSSFRDLYSLTGRTALVTGASQGIGAAIASILGDMGAQIAVNHLDDGENARGVVERLRALGR